MKAPADKIEGEIAKGYVKVRHHPTLPLRIFNYSDFLQAHWKDWNETNMMCRGLVLNANYNIVAKGFDKFFTIEQGARIPDEDFVVQEKLDGSMIEVFDYQGQMVVCTRGSFISEQVGMAKEILEDKYPDFYPEKGFTYIFELIHHVDRKIVRYEKDDLYLLSVIRMSDLKEFTPTKHRKIFPRPEFYSGYNDIHNLPYSEKATDAEGYVLRFHSGHRIKCKSPAYIQAHRVFYGTNEKRVWEMMKDGKNVYDIIEGLPDEFYQEIDEIVKGFKKEYDNFEFGSYQVWDQIEKELGDSDRKSYALKIKEYGKGYEPVLFSILSGKSTKPVIWKMIRPDKESS